MSGSPSKGSTRSPEKPADSKNPGTDLDAIQQLYEACMIDDEDPATPVNDKPDSLSEIQLATEKSPFISSAPKDTSSSRSPSKQESAILDEKVSPLKLSETKLASSSALSPVVETPKTIASESNKNIEDSPILRSSPSPRALQKDRFESRNYKPKSPVRGSIKKWENEPVLTPRLPDEVPESSGSAPDLAAAGSVSAASSSPVLPHTYQTELTKKEHSSGLPSEEEPEEEDEEKPDVNMTSTEEPLASVSELGFKSRGVRDSDNNDAAKTLVGEKNLDTEVADDDGSSVYDSEEDVEPMADKPLDEPVSSAVEDSASGATATAPCKSSVMSVSSQNATPVPEVLGQNVAEKRLRVDASCLPTTVSATTAETSADKPDGFEDSSTSNVTEPVNTADAEEEKDKQLLPQAKPLSVVPSEIGATNALENAAGNGLDEDVVGIKAPEHQAKNLPAKGDSVSGVRELHTAPASLAADVLQKEKQMKGSTSIVASNISTTESSGPAETTKVTSKPETGVAPSITTISSAVLTSTSVLDHEINDEAVKPGQMLSSDNKTRDTSMNEDSHAVVEPKTKAIDRASWQKGNKDRTELSDDPLPPLSGETLSLRDESPETRSDKASKDSKVNPVTKVESAGEPLETPATSVPEQLNAPAKSGAKGNLGHEAVVPEGEASSSSEESSVVDGEEQAKPMDKRAKDEPPKLEEKDVSPEPPHHFSPRPCDAASEAYPAGQVAATAADSLEDPTSSSKSGDLVEPVKKPKENPMAFGDDEIVETGNSQEDSERVAEKNIKVGSVPVKEPQEDQDLPLGTSLESLGGKAESQKDTVAEVLPESEDGSGSFKLADAATASSSEENPHVHSSKEELVDMLAPSKESDIKNSAVKHTEAAGSDDSTRAASAPGVSRTVPLPEPKKVTSEPSKESAIEEPKAAAQPVVTSETVFLYMSMASGGRGAMAKFNKAAGILKAEEIDYVPVEITMDEKAKRLWKYQGLNKGKNLPAVVRDGELKLSYEELLEASEYEEVRDLVFDDV